MGWRRLIDCHVLLFGMQLTFDKYTLTSYFHAILFKPVLMRDQRCLSRAASRCLSGGVRSGLMK